VTIENSGAISLTASMIDRYLVRYFLAVVDHGNFSKAAAAANVSQPTLSVGIAKLERLLGRALFVRTNRRVEMTEAAARFVGHARRIESEFSLAHQAVNDAKVRRTFRLGVLTSIPSAWLAQFATRLAESARGELLELVEGRESELLDGLGRSRLDAALTIMPTGDGRFVGERLLTEGYALAISDRHPLANEEEIEPEALAADAMIVRRHCEALSETSRHFTSHGVRPFLAFRTINDERALALVQAGLGITVMPDGFTAPGVRRPRLVGFNITRSIGLLHAHRSDRNVGLGEAALVAITETLERLTSRKARP